MIGISVWKITDYFADKKLDKQLIENKKVLLKNNELKKINEGHYRKLVQDTLTEKELRKEIEELRLKVKDGVLIGKVKTKPKDIEKKVDTIIIDNTKKEVTITDFYPKKEDWFIKYKSTVDLLKGEGTGIFSFNEIGIDLVLSENDNGTFSADLKAPDFIQINSLEVLSKPMKPTEKVDNFGILVGGKYNKNMSDGNNGYEILGGIRYKKVNIIGSVNTNTDVGVGLLIEF